MDHAVLGFGKKLECQIVALAPIEWSLVILDQFASLDSFNKTLGLFFVPIYRLAILLARVFQRGLTATLDTLPYRSFSHEEHRKFAEKAQSSQNSTLSEFCTFFAISAVKNL